MIYRMPGSSKHRQAFCFHFETIVSLKKNYSLYKKSSIVNTKCNKNAYYRCFLSIFAFLS